MPVADPFLVARLRAAAEPIAAYARLSSSRWSVRVPLSVRLQGGASRLTIAAGGQQAPQAYTMEGRADGRAIAHPVFGHGPRIRGPMVDGRYRPPGWTWVKQPPRPFLAEAIDATQDEMLRIFAGVIDDWAKQRGYR